MYQSHSNKQKKQYGKGGMPENSDTLLVQFCITN